MDKETVMPRNDHSDYVVDTTASKHAALWPVAVSAVRLTDGFWAPRIKSNHETTLAEQFAQCESTGRIDNFRIASGRKTGEFQGAVFNDSDVYKWLEAAAWSLAGSSATGDGPVAAQMDAVIAEIAAAQQPDGYLNTYFMGERANQRYVNFKDWHELYCYGHLFQAAIAHYRVTGGGALLDVAVKAADHLCRTFGPAEDGKRPAVPGHEEVEMALFELGRLTKNQNYARLAEYFINARGHGLIGGGAYHQDHKPVRDMDRMIGHAVRAVYLNCGVADMAMETGDPALVVALERMWNNMTQKQLYVSGGIGSRHEGEAFGADFELPNARAYTETCAAIASVMWNWRMLLLTGEQRFADLLEHTLYNGVLSGLALDGNSYFYVNPLADDGRHRRQAWFGCACCPPNVARMIASLPGYFYSVSHNTLWVHLYAQGAAEVQLPDGRIVKITQTTSYPWDGRIHLQIDAAGPLDVMLRIPAWCADGGGDEKPALQVAGRPVSGTLTPGAYAKIGRVWTSGDTVAIQLPMPARRIVCHPFVAENRNCVALMRGPLLYCLEAADNPGFDLRNLTLPDAGAIEARPSSLLNGVVTLHGHGLVHEVKADGPLYQNNASANRSRQSAVAFTAIPYYAWANRQPGPMQVWLART